MRSAQRFRAKDEEEVYCLGNEERRDSATGDEEHSDVKKWITSNWLLDCRLGRDGGD